MEPQANSELGLGLGIVKGLQLEICTPSDFTTPDLASNSPTTLGSETSPNAAAGTGDGENGVVDATSTFSGEEENLSLMDTTFDSSDWSSDTESDCDLDLEENEEEIEAISPHESLLDIPAIPSPPNSTLPPVSLAPVSSSSQLGPTFAQSGYMSSSSAPIVTSPIPPTYPFSSLYGCTGEGALGPINPALSLFPLPKLSSIPAYPLRDAYPDMEYRGTPPRVTPWARGCLLRSPIL